MPPKATTTLLLWTKRKSIKLYPKRTKEKFSLMHKAKKIYSFINIFFESKKMQKKKFFI